MFSFAMTSALASESDKFEIIITLRKALKKESKGHIKISFSCITLSDKFKIIITLRRAQKRKLQGHKKISFSCITLSTPIFQLHFI